MELDDMKLAWQAFGAQLERQHALQMRIVREHGLDKLRRSLLPLRVGQSLQIAFGVAVMLWGVLFWSTHTGDWKAMACGIVVQVYGILMVAFAGKLLFMQHGIDYAAPVLEIQHRLAAMRAWRVRVEAPLFVLLGCFIWVPMVLMVLLRDADRVGFDLWRVAPGLTTWLAINGGVTLLLALLAWAVLRRFGKTRWLQDNFAGSAVRRAEATLADIARFERE